MSKDFKKTPLHQPMTFEEKRGLGEMDIHLIDGMVSPRSLKGRLRGESDIWPDRVPIEMEYRHYLAQELRKNKK